MCAVIVEPSNCGIRYTPMAVLGECDDQPLDLGRPIFETEFTILKMQPDYMAVREILDFVPWMDDDLGPIDFA